MAFNLMALQISSICGSFLQLTQLPSTSSPPSPDPRKLLLRPAREEHVSHVGVLMTVVVRPADLESCEL
eukprot:233860-Hanusia_phi.AAC.3